MATEAVKVVSVKIEGVDPEKVEYDLWGCLLKVDAPPEILHIYDPYVEERVN